MQEQMRLILPSLTAALLLFGAGATGAELRGHGGPVRAIAVAPGGAVITGSFDTRAIVWSLETGAAREVLLFHAGQVNAVAALPDGSFATGGADGRVAIWEPGRDAPARILEGHAGPVAALAVSPDGATLASASWDASVRLWPLAGGEPRVLEGHAGNVNAVAFLADGALVSAGYDGNLVFWPPAAGGAPTTVTLPAPLNALVTLPGDRVAAGGADGTLRVLDRGGATLAERQVGSAPVTAAAVSTGGKHLAAADVGGSVAVFDAASLAPARELTGAGQPVWALAFAPDGKTLLIAGADRVVREWDVETGERLGGGDDAAADPLAEYAGTPDAEAFRACVACHTLDPDDGDRAGPTLHGIFGRRIASAPGYHYSAALRGMDIVWTPETVAKLFEVGPAAYTPGTKMPEQTIGDAEDRAALIRFLRSAAGGD
jgi:cytochrome c